MKEIPQVVWCELVLEPLPLAWTGSKFKRMDIFKTYKFNPLDKAFVGSGPVNFRINNGWTMLQQYRVKRKGGLG